jgi:flagellar assembly protein FliH
MSWWSEPASPLPRVVRDQRAAKATSVVFVPIARPRPGGEPIAPSPDVIADSRWKAGYEAGVGEGRRQAERSVAETQRKLLAPVLGALHQALDTIESQRLAVLELAEEELARLALDTVQTILGFELASRSEPGLDAIRRALALVPNDLHAVVRLNPADAEALSRAMERRDNSSRPWADDSPWYGLDRRFEVVPDDSIGRGSAIAEVGPTTIDASIESALERLREALGAPRPCSLVEADGGDSGAPQAAQAN